MALPLALVTAALQAVAGLGSRAFDDARRAREQNEMRAQRRKEQVDSILRARSQAGGVNTSVSDLADSDQRFERDLAIQNRNNPLTGFLPLVQAGTTIGSAILSEPEAKKEAPMSRESVFQPTVDKIDDDEMRKRSLIQQLASKYGGY